MEGHIQTSSRCCDWPLRMIAGPEEKIFTESLKRLYYLSYYDLNRGRNGSEGHSDEMSEG